MSDHQPHLQTIANYILLVALAVFGWLGRVLFARMVGLEERMRTVERDAAAASEWRQENSRRLERIEQQMEQIGLKLDRVIERVSGRRPGPGAARGST